MDKDEEYRIIEDEPKITPKNIIVVIHARKQEKTKPQLVDIVNLQFNHFQGFEVICGTFGINPKQPFQTIHKEITENGKEILNPIYTFDAFEQLLTSFFEDNNVTHYNTSDTQDLFLYLKTPIRISENKPVYPELELGFISKDNMHEPNVFANVYENKHQIVKEIEFKTLNETCKAINTKRHEQTPKF